MVLSPDSCKHYPLPRGVGAGLAILESVYFLLEVPVALLQILAAIPNPVHAPIFFFFFSEPVPVFPVLFLEEEY